MKILTKEVKNTLTDVFNATNCSTPLCEHIDEQLTITGYVKFVDIDTQTGEDKEYIGLVCDNGKTVSTGSPIFIKAFDTLLDTLADNDLSINDGIKILPIKETSKGGKDFYNFILC